MAKVIERLSLMDIAPPSITGDRKVKNIITSITPELSNVSQEIREAFIISRINELPEEALDLLAWQWHVDFYELAHTLDTKRAMVLESISWHRKKGTRGAILEALNMLGVEAKFTAWHELQDEGAQPYTFVIDAKLTSDFWERVDWTKPTQTIRRAIEESKAARSWMSRLYVYMETQAQHDIGIGTGTFWGAHHGVNFAQKTSGSDDLNIYIGTGTFQRLLHDIAIVQATYSASESGLNVGAGIIQGSSHDIDMVQGISGNSGLDMFIGTGTFHTWTHDVRHIWAAGTEAGSTICTGANVVQSAGHKLDIQQHTSGSSSLEVFVGTAAFQRLSHDIGIQQATRGIADGEFCVGADIVHGSHHDINLHQHHSGGIESVIPVWTGIRQNITHGVGIERLQKGCGVSGVCAGTVINQGNHHDIGMAKPAGSFAVLNILAGTGILQSAVHAISVGMSTPARAEIYAGAVLTHGISYGVGVKLDSTTKHCDIAVVAGINQGSRYSIALHQAISGGAKSDVYLGVELCSNVAHEVSIMQSQNCKADSVLCTASGVIHGKHHVISAVVSTQAKHKVFTGTAIMQDISHTIGMKKCESVSAGGILTGCAMSCGVYMKIRMAA